MARMFEITHADCPALAEIGVAAVAINLDAVSIVGRGGNTVKINFIGCTGKEVTELSFVDKDVAESFYNRFVCALAMGESIER